MGINGNVINIEGRELALKLNVPSPPEPVPRREPENSVHN